MSRRQGRGPPRRAAEREQAREREAGPRGSGDAPGRPPCALQGSQEETSRRKGATLPGEFMAAPPRPGTEMGIQTQEAQELRQEDPKETPPYPPPDARTKTPTVQGRGLSPPGASPQGEADLLAETRPVGRERRVQAKHRRAGKPASGAAPREPRPSAGGEGLPHTQGPWLSGRKGGGSGGNT